MLREVLVSISSILFSTAQHEKGNTPAGAGDARGQKSKGKLLKGELTCSVVFMSRYSVCKVRYNPAFSWSLVTWSAFTMTI